VRISTTETAVEFRVLGPLEVLAEGRPVALGGTKQRALLAVLLLHAGQVVPAERLIDDLWGDAPPNTAANALWVHVAGLRKALEPGRRKGQSGTVLVTRPPGYLLKVDREALDVARFDGLVAAARQALADGQAGQAAGLLRQALALWRGPALADLASEPFAQPWIVALEERRLTAIEDRIQADLACGRQQELVDELEALIVGHPLRERLREQLMLALYRAGRQAEALEVYRRTRKTLADQLGIDPIPALQRLEQAILSQDPTLAPAPAPAASPAAGPAPPPSTAPAAPEVRKTVTIVCLGFIAIWHGQELDPESFQRLEGRYLGEVRAVLERHGARLERLTGEAAMAVFGIPVVHENDALRAMRAACDMRALMERLSAEFERSLGIRLSVSVGVHTGEVVGGQASLTGSVLRVAARLEQAAHAGEILLSAATYELVRDAVKVEPGSPLQLEGRSAPLVAWRLDTVSPHASRDAQRLDIAMVGRDRELALLGQAFERVLAERTCQLFTVLGPAGVGKSRLVHEFLTRVGGQATVLRGRCLDYGEGITFWPIIEILQEAAAIQPPDSPPAVRAKLAALVEGEEHAERLAEQLVGLFGLAQPATPEDELRWALRRLFAALAGRHPLVLVLDDLHWAEPTLLDVIEDLVELARDVPLLVCCIARSELLERRHGWAGGKPNATTILLEPLTPAEAMLLVDRLLGGADLDASARNRVVEAGGGNPLFVEELVAMLLDNPALASGAAGRRATGVDPTGTPIPIPATIAALLAARLDQLGDQERALLQRASIIGQVFTAQAVAELSREPAPAATDTRWQALMRKELIRADRSPAAGGDAFRFRHLLIRDAASATLPKHERADLHARYAAWLEQTAADRLPEHQEILGFHLEQAARLRAELDPSDRPARDLARSAAEHLGSAGRRATGRGDMAAALRLFQRAIALFPHSDRMRLELLPPLGVALHETGALTESDAVLTEAIQAATAAGDRRLAWHATIERCWLRMLTQPEQLPTAHAAQQAGQAIEVFTELADDAGLAKSWRLLGEVNNLRCRMAAMAEAAERARQHARRSGDAREEWLDLSMVAVALDCGPTPVVEAIQHCETLLDSVPDRQRWHAGLLGPLAHLLAKQGDLAGARKLLPEGRGTAEELGTRWAIPWYAWWSGNVEALAGDLERAEQELRRGFALYQQMGEQSMLSTLAADLAEVLHAQGQDREALRCTEVSEAAAGHDDVWSQTIWRAARAKVLARFGQLAAADRLAREAVRLAHDTDFLDMRASALLALADVLRVAGQPHDAKPLVAEAVRLYVQKGNRSAAAKARALLAPLQ
jgi:DNA-binding SARP family transcriptional activator/class 3 adenylate cyclase/tetratricopeptide (TPR) repeat protein